ncbi:hypothetical protein ACP275_08G192000 [Erythranthe tilingii]
MAEHCRSFQFLVFLVFFSCFACSSFAYQFVAGGRDGWVVKPSENYSQWAQRMRFQVNDTILFKYSNASDSAAVVSKDDYDNCNAGNPLLKLDGGNSVFKFDRSGPFYFISGNKANCDQGQKLTVVVLAVRNRLTPPANSPSPAAAPPTGSSSLSPPSPSPSGGAPPPATSPSSSDGARAPATNGSGAPSPGGVSSTPAENSAPGTGSPPRRNLAAPSCAPSIVLVAAVSLVFQSIF